MAGEIKKAGFPAFLWFFAVFCRALVVLRRALEVVSLAPVAIRPQGVVGAAARALDDQEVNVALSKFFAAVLAAQFGERLGGGYAHG